jgi:hypothetical protein
MLRLLNVVIGSEKKWSEEPSPALRDELTDFVGRSRHCRSKAEGNLLIILYISHLKVMINIKIIQYFIFFID